MAVAKGTRAPARTEHGVTRVNTIWQQEIDDQTAYEMVDLIIAWRKAANGFSKDPTLKSEMQLVRKLIAELGRSFGPSLVTQLASAANIDVSTYALTAIDVELGTFGCGEPSTEQCDELRRLGWECIRIADALSPK
jgi:hypothetical protein